MNPADLKRLMDWAAKSPLLELEVVEGDVRVHLVKGEPAAVGAPMQPETATREPREHIVTAPLPGLLYLAPSPDAARFVFVGQRVGAGDTVGLIEAMKMFNPVVSDADGVVVAILARAGQEVAVGQPLISLRHVEIVP